MLGVGDERVAVEPFGEKLLAKRDGFLRLHLVDAGREPVVLRRLDDERGPVFVEAVGVEIEPAPLRLREIEGEGVELLLLPSQMKRLLPDWMLGLKMDSYLRRVTEKRRRRRPRASRSRAA